MPCYFWLCSLWSNVLEREGDLVRMTKQRAITSIEGELKELKSLWSGFEPRKVLLTQVEAA